MTSIERDTPSSTEPVLRSDALCETFHSLTRLYKQRYPHQKYDSEDATMFWSDDESGIILETRHEQAWNGAGQILTMTVSNPPHIPTQSQRTLVVDHFYKLYEPGTTQETIQLFERTRDDKRTQHEAKDVDIKEFETICQFLETVTLNQIRKQRLQSALAKPLALSEMLGQLETSEEALFLSQDF